MKQFKTSIVLFLLFSFLLIPQVSAEVYDVFIGIGFFNPIILPNTEIGLEQNDTVFGYFVHRAAFQNGTRLERFDSIGDNTTLIVGNETSRLDSYVLGMQTIGYTFILDDYALPLVESTFEFVWFTNESRETLPITTFQFPQDISNQIPCLNQEQEICEGNFLLKVITNQWNITFNGGISIYARSNFEGNDDSFSPVAIFLWTAVILLAIFLFVKFLSK
ncbi:MAG: hypothetical protein D6732_21105 [Methanobacteriota archaeon]|nr:MAG: hypothetical protein D6732_21105 [Euryarchaeota archaeon]